MLILKTYEFLVNYIALYGHQACVVIIMGFIIIISIRRKLCAETNMCYTCIILNDMHV